MGQVLAAKAGGLAIKAVFLVREILDGRASVKETGETGVSLGATDGGAVEDDVGDTRSRLTQLFHEPHCSLLLQRRDVDYYYERLLHCKNYLPESKTDFNHLL